MTRSKLDLATILVKLRGDDSQDPVKLAKEMSLLKLCYEIQKIEEAKEEEPQAEEATLTKKEEAIVEELKAPEKATSKQRHKHILSWLLDSSSDEEET
jgi:hypothetical protein